MQQTREIGLNPTLWRTCRVLANRIRLRMLGAMLRRGEVPVSALAVETGVSEIVASQYLRALGARGLIAARRQGRWVFYRPVADPSVRGSAELLAAVSSTLAGKPRAAERVFRLATAFTHPRRVSIVRLLQDGPMTVEALARKAGISRFALRRHLAKLAARGFARKETDAWRLVRPRGRLASSLLHLACRD